MMRLMVVLAIWGSAALARPQKNQKDQDLPPMPYQFTNLVSEQEADPNGIYWTQNEGAEESNPGRVEGSYSVWQPDGRLMTVNYYVDGESGFVPTITYSDNYSPEWSAAPAAGQRAQAQTKAPAKQTTAKKGRKL